MKVAVFLVFLLLSFSLFSQTDKWVVQKIATKDAIHDIEVVNDSLTYIYTYGTGKVFKTIDGGLNWSLIAELDSVYFEQIQFIDEKRGWLVGSPNKIYSTNDGGKTWEDKHIRAEENNQLGLVYGMYFEDFNNGFVAVGGKSKAGITTNIYKTNDAGKTWDLINSIDEILVNIEKIGNDIFASGRNTIIKNIDSKDYSYTFTDTAQTVGLIRDIDLNNSGQLVAVSDNGLILRQDSKNWVQEKLTKNRLRCIKATGKNSFIVVGDNNKEEGNLFISNNNGKTWLIGLNKYPDIHRVDISDNYIWMVGKNGFVAREKR